MKARKSVVISEKQHYFNFALTRPNFIMPSVLEQPIESTSHHRRNAAMRAALRRLHETEEIFMFF
jgi:hypothetical protein